MQAHFSAKPGAYYADALFFISLAFYKAAPSTLKKIVFIDVDCKVVTDIRELFLHFSQFQKDNVIGLTHELTPVYRHVLHTYRAKHNNTPFGGPRKNGFPGFNSGVILMDLDKLRSSVEYASLLSKTVIDVLAAKYNFKGHLGDQDFFTLTGFEYPELYYVLPCEWNRQLCRWWEHRGYEEVFESYFECSDKTKIYHANCNSEFPDF
ncbi:hypothetical protein QYM36_007705 [Artemia franciscana]|nr:hypothetical protein QYM36_007705 [Artemia franciscana]